MKATRRYVELPKLIGHHIIDCKEMLFYQYLLIKLAGQHEITSEKRLNCFDDIIGQVCCDYIGEYGLDNYVNSNVYITAKHMYQHPGCSYNREGWHSDGFMTDDVNYIWSNNNGFTYNKGEFNLTQCHTKSMQEMKDQATSELNIVAGDNELYRMDQYVIHRVSEVLQPCMRTFLKISISKDKYNLIGNSKNYMLNYDWEMKPRQTERNHPSM